MMQHLERLAQIVIANMYCHKMMYVNSVKWLFVRNLVYPVMKAPSTAFPKSLRLCMNNAECLTKIKAEPYR